MPKVGFIGLGNVGGKLAASLIRNNVDLTVRDLDSAIAQPFLDGGAKWADSPREMAQNVDVLIKINWAAYASTGAVFRSSHG